MGRCFNTTGSCDPQIHYMVDIQERLAEIKKLVDDGKYFTIFESLMGKLLDYPDLEKKLYTVLFSGDTIVYSPFDASIDDMAQMFGFVKKSDGAVVIANRIFEMLLYDYFLTAGDSLKRSLENAVGL